MNGKFSSVCYLQNEKKKKTNKHDTLHSNMFFFLLNSFI
jgi:hypothetical protein